MPPVPHSPNIGGDGDPGDSGFGGGIYQTSGTLTLTNSIVAANSPSGSGPDVFTSLDFGSIHPAGVNLLSNLDDSGLSAGSNVLVVTVPLLAPLGNYGGPTQTMPPLPGSSDQRGFPRFVVGALDSCQGTRTFTRLMDTNFYAPGFTFFPWAEE